MFVRDSNGRLLNLDKVEFIHISVVENNCTVRAVYTNRFGNDSDVALYRSNELQDCQQYLDELDKRIGLGKFW